MKFSIGEFSRITSLSVKTLRLYHEKELLIPTSVDEFTNYRYYDEKNIETARTIKILREYDFSLAEIKTIIEQYNDESEILEHLVKKKDEITAKIDRFEKVSRSLEMIIKNEKESNMNNQNVFEIEEKEIPTILIAGYRMKGKYAEVGKGFGILAKHLGRQINGKAMNLYYDDEFKEEDAEFEPCFPIRKGKETESVSIRELKGGLCVSLIHQGSYEKLGDSYGKIFNYINENGYNYSTPTREVYIKGPGFIFKGNPNNYLTEIQILIDKKQG